MGSPANAAVRDYLVSELRGLGVAPQVQRATAAYYPVPGFLQAGRSENVLARLPGTDRSGKAFLLAAHYDSVPTSPGATDDGSGVATMLETLRALRAAPPLRNDVIFLFTDGEERGLLGARAFVEQHPWAGDVGVVLNLDTRGNTGPALMLKTNDEGGWVIDEFAKATPYPMTTSDSVAFFKRSGGNSDLSVFLDAGWAGLQVSSTGGISHYHSALDNVAELDERSLQHLGSYALALTRHFGSVSLEQTRAPDQVYFNLFRFLVHYPQAWSIPLAVFTLLLGGGVITLGLRRGHLRLSGLGLGFAVLPVAMAAAAAAAQLTWTVILALHPGGVLALEYRPAIIWIGFASLTVAVTATLYAALRNRIQIFDLAVGGTAVVAAAGGDDECGVSARQLLVHLAAGVQPAGPRDPVRRRGPAYHGLAEVHGAHDHRHSGRLLRRLGGLRDHDDPRAPAAVRGSVVRNGHRVDAGPDDPAPRPHGAGRPLGSSRRDHRTGPWSVAHRQPERGLRCPASAAGQHLVRAQHRHRAGDLGKLG